MANEAVLMFETELPLPFTVDNSTGIEKGALLTLSDPMTAALVTDSTAAFAGIACEEKIASDGRTKLGAYRGGIFKVVASGAVTVGDSVVFEAVNTVAAQGETSKQSAGIALETAASGETFLFELRPHKAVIA